jgi:CubicO group peptidase (beta-lactamase class C family)
MLLHLNVFSKVDDIHNATAKIMTTHRIPDCAVVKYKNSKLDFDNYGKSHGADISDSSLFVLGSTTKAFTGLAIQMIADDSYINLDNNISDYIPGLQFLYKGEKTNITIRQLLSHSSGIPYETLYNLPSGDYKGVIEKSVQEINGIELDFAPGSKYQYVNMNYTILAYLLEIITGKSYEFYIQENILLPLGMNDTYLYLDQATQKGTFVNGSRTFLGRIIEYNAELEGANKPAGGMITCTADLSKWIKAQMGELSIPDNLRNAIIRTHDISQCAYTPQKGENYYLFGWHISADGENIMHTGGIQNYGSCVMINLKSRTAVAVLCNSMLSPAVYIAENYMTDLRGADQYNIGFVSVATLDIICSFICLLLLYLIINMVLKAMKEKSTLAKTSSLIIKTILLCCISIVLVCLPYLIGYTYAMLWKWSAMTMIFAIIEGILFCVLKIYFNGSLLWKQTLRK